MHRPGTTTLPNCSSRCHTSSQARQANATPALKLPLPVLCAGAKKSLQPFFLSAAASSMHCCPSMRTSWMKATWASVSSSHDLATVQQLPLKVAILSWLPAPLLALGPTGSAKLPVDPLQLIHNLLGYAFLKACLLVLLFVDLTASSSLDPLSLRARMGL